MYELHNGNSQLFGYHLYEEYGFFDFNMKGKKSISPSFFLSMWRALMKG